jgi:hypothetical protein
VGRTFSVQPEKNNGGSDKLGPSLTSLEFINDESGEAIALEVLAVCDRRALRFLPDLRTIQFLNQYSRRIVLHARENAGWVQTFAVQPNFVLEKSSFYLGNKLPPQLS